MDMPEEIVSCGYQIRQEGEKRELIIKCRECEEDFSMESCIPGIVLALEKEYNISSVILSDYIERQYTGIPLDILEFLAKTGQELDRMATRNVKKTGCKDCAIHPGRMYPGLKKTLMVDTGEVYGQVVDLSKTVMGMKGCDGCRKAAKEELAMIGEELLRLKSRVLLEAYGIVG